MNKHLPIMLTGHATYGSTDKADSFTNSVLVTAVPREGEFVHYMTQLFRVSAVHHHISTGEIVVNIGWPLYDNRNGGS